VKRTTSTASFKSDIFQQKEEKTKDQSLPTQKKKNE
jgi:hypothetical protein